MKFMIHFRSEKVYLASWITGIMIWSQEDHNSIANALELHLSSTNPSRPSLQLSPDDHLVI